MKPVDKRTNGYKRRTESTKRATEAFRTNQGLPNTGPIPAFGQLVCLPGGDLKGPGKQPVNNLAMPKVFYGQTDESYQALQLHLQKTRPGQNLGFGARRARQRQRRAAGEGQDRFCPGSQSLPEMAGAFVHRHLLK